MGSKWPATKPFPYYLVLLKVYLHREVVNLTKKNFPYYLVLLKEYKEFPHQHSRSSLLSILFSSSQSIARGLWCRAKTEILSILFSSSQSQFWGWAAMFAKKGAFHTIQFFSKGKALEMIWLSKYSFHTIQFFSKGPRESMWFKWTTHLSILFSSSQRDDAWEFKTMAISSFPYYLVLLKANILEHSQGDTDTLSILFSSSQSQQTKRGETGEAQCFPY